MVKPKYPITLAQAQREKLRKMVEEEVVPDRVATRIRVVLLTDEGMSSSTIADRVGLSQSRVWRWRKRFHAEGLDGLSDRPRPGRPRKDGNGGVEVEE